jgi:hypothetical protein
MPGMRTMQAKEQECGTKPIGNISKTGLLMQRTAS